MTTDNECMTRGRAYYIVTFRAVVPIEFIVYIIITIIITKYTRYIILYINICKVYLLTKQSSNKIIYAIYMHIAHELDSLVK